MSPEDPRHGTYAGFQLHKAEHEPPCETCRFAGYRYTKAMKMRLARTGSNLVPLGQAAHDIVTRYPVRLISELTGVTDPKLYGWRATGPASIVHIKTRNALLSINPADLWTPVGIRRRVRALTALGHAAPAIAEVSGLSRSAILTVRGTGDLAFIRRPTATGVRAAYEVMSMTTPAVDSPRGRAVVTRSKALAAKHGWAPPLAWEDIDDPDETPRDWHYRAPDRRDAVAEYADAGMTATQAARALHTSREGLEVWCRRHGLSAEYRRMAAREAIGQNKWLKEGA